MTSRSSAPRVLLIGAGYTGRLVAAELARLEGGPVLVAILDDDSARTGEHIGGAEVVGPVNLLPEVANRYSVDEVVIAIPSVRGSRLREIAMTCRAAGLAVRTMPGIVELLGRSITPRQLRPVELGDLLRRSEVRCDEPPPEYLRGQRVLITGAGGSIGRELARQVCRAAPELVVLLGHGENSIHGVYTELANDPASPALVPVIADITDRRSLERAFIAHRPTVVFHAAAHKHVPLMEMYPSAAVRNNVVGTQNVLACAQAADVARFLFVSTDKAVAPASVMGASKRVCEWLVRDAATRAERPYVAVRFGNVLGSRGSVVPVLERQIARGGPVTLTHPDMTRFFMTIPEAVYLVLQAGGMDDGQGIYVLDMGAPVRLVDLAEDLLLLSGITPGTMAVEFTGLRPGEKLSEALWEPDSTITATSQAGVLRVRESGQPPGGARLTTLVRGLQRAGRRGDAAGIHRLLQAAIPTFTSSLAGEVVA